MDYVKIFQSFFRNLWKRLFWIHIVSIPHNFKSGEYTFIVNIYKSPKKCMFNPLIDELYIYDRVLSKKEIEMIIKMWKIKHYIIDIDSYSENKEQKTCCNSSKVIGKQITKKQFKKIMKIVGEENA